MLKYVAKYYKKHNVKLEPYKVLGYLTVYKDEMIPLLQTVLGIDKCKELLSFIPQKIESFGNSLVSLFSSSKPMEKEHIQ